MEEEKNWRREFRMVCCSKAATPSSKILPVTENLGISFNNDNFHRKLEIDIFVL